jgi:hypothetical protein
MSHLIGIELDNEVAKRLLERIEIALETQHASDEVDPDLEAMDKAIREALGADDAEEGE